MKFPLFEKLPKFEELSNDLILDRFLEYVSEKGLSLYPAQEEAILSLVEGQNVILNTPTGSGKSLVATALHFHSLSQGKRSIYTCPIKALVNEKFLNLAKEFGPEQVGMVTGDGAVNPDAPILCCTAEILANMALRDGEDALADDIVMDEFHYYSDRERGGAWQIPLLTLKRARFLLMSATLGEMDFFSKEMTQLTGKETAVVSGNDRPVPLEFEYRETPLHETIQDLIEKGKSPIYLVNFTQANATDEAQNLMSVDFTSKEAKKQITERLNGIKFSSPFGKDIQRYLKHGVGLHHAGLLPKYRVLVEKLAQEGLLRVIS
ncbi:MAG: DEAD/DEAH box helicase, partial [Proteobacteria bacterium]